MNKSCQIQVIREDRNENRAGWKESTIARPELHLTPKNEILRSAHQGRKCLSPATCHSQLGAGPAALVHRAEFMQGGCRSECCVRVSEHPTCANFCC